MKKKILAIGLVVCMLVVAIGSATMAYFTDTEGATNVMVVGEIDIEQTETGADGSEFKDGQHLLPDVTIVKKVEVENVGRSDAFVRTLIAFEGTKEFVEGKLTVDGSIISANNYVGQITVDGEEYTLYMYVHEDALAKGDKVTGLLNSFTLKPEVTQGEVAFAGEEYNILVLTQAVQAEGVDTTAAAALDKAFGKIDANSHPWGTTMDWFGEGDADIFYLTTASDLRGFAELVNSGSAESKKLNNKTVKLAADIDLAGIEWTPIKTWNGPISAITFDGNDYTISNMTVTGVECLGFIGSSTADWTIKNLTFEKANVTGTWRFIGTVIGYQYGDVVMENVTVKNSEIKSTSTHDYGIRIGGLVGFHVNNDKTGKSTLSLNNCHSTGNTISGYHNVGGLVGTVFAGFGETASMTGCTSTDNTFYYGGTYNETKKAARAFDCDGYNEGASVKTNCTESGNTYIKSQKVADATDLASKVSAASGATVELALPAGETTTNIKIPGGSNVTLVGATSDPADTVLSGQIATTASNEGTLVIKNCTINVDDAIVDSTGISQTGKSAIAIWGDQTVICENVVFNMSKADSTAITSWWDTGVGTSIIVKDCTFNCNGQRPIRATGNVTVENCTFNDPYRYAVQLTAKASTATELDKAIVNFKNNTIVNGENGKAFVYGIQLEGADYGCNDLVINGAGNTIVDGGAESTMYYCECGKVVHDTIEWNVEVTPVHEA